jgi:antibiotic biosynthesis monooxygenase (ABM) superfamily enzyme
MVSGYDKYGDEYAPPRESRRFKERVVIWIVFIAAVAVGALLGSTLG